MKNNMPVAMGIAVPAAAGFIYLFELLLERAKTGDKEAREEIFLFFQTADQLEKIILGTVAENVVIIMEAGIEEVSMGFC